MSIDESQWNSGMKFPDYDRNICQIPRLMAYGFGLSGAGNLLPADIAFDPLLKREIQVLFFVDAFAKADIEESEYRIPFLGHMLSQGHTYNLDTGAPTSTPLQAPAIHTGLTTQELGNFEFYQYHPLVRNGTEVMGSILMNLPDSGHLAQRGSLVYEGLDPTSIYDVETIYQRLSGHGVHCTNLMPAAYIGSAYNNIMGRGSTVTGYRNFEELITLLGEIVETGGIPAYIVVYIPTVDEAAHVYGPGSDEHVAAQALVMETIRDFRMKLPESLARQTTIGLVADHGQVPINGVTDTEWMHEWSWLRPCLRTDSKGNPMRPTGSPTNVALHLKPEQVDYVIQRLRQEYQHKAWIIRSKQAVDLGLFGKGMVNKHLFGTLGDVLIFGHPGHYFWWKTNPTRPYHMKGSHGGLAKRLVEVYYILCAADEL